jgi:hypothetical protein
VLEDVGGEFTDHQFEVTREIRSATGMLDELTNPVTHGGQFGRISPSSDFESARCGPVLRGVHATGSFPDWAATKPLPSRHLSSRHDAIVGM